jgi:hypothetical protein
MIRVKRKQMIRIKRNVDGQSEENEEDHSKRSI